MAVTHGVEQWVGRSLLSHLCAIDDWLAVALDSVLSPTYVSEKASFGRTASVSASRPFMAQRNTLVALASEAHVHISICVATVLVASGLSMLEDAKQARTLVRGESSQSNL